MTYIPKVLRQLVPRFDYPDGSFRRQHTLLTHTVTVDGVEYVKSIACYDPYGIAATEKEFCRLLGDGHHYLPVKTDDGDQA
jgi:hypothetical protein